MWIWRKVMMLCELLYSPSREAQEQSSEPAGA